MCIVQLVELSKAQDVEAGDVVMCINVVELVELCKAQDVKAGDVIVMCVCVLYSW